MKRLVRELDTHFRKLNTLLFGEEDLAKPGAPCTEAELAALGRSFKLPPSYEAFLRIHNGWTEFLNATPILSTGDREEVWYSKRLEEIRLSLLEFNDPDFLSTGFLIALASSEHELLYFDTTKATGEGEFEVVYHSVRNGEYERFANFTEFLEKWLSSLKEQIAREEA